MRLLTPWIILGPCIAGAVGLVGCSEGQSPEKHSTGHLALGLVDDAHRFSLDADPGLELIRVEYLGGYSFFSTSFSLYADGRLTIQLSNPGGDQEVINSYETELSFQDVRDLVGTVVLAGFMECSRESIHEQRKVAQGSRALFRTSDAPDMVTTVNLERYRAPGEAHFAPATNTVTLQSSENYAHRFPDLLELQSLALLHDALQQRLQAARQSGK